jgi:hypothetical protein
MYEIYFKEYINMTAIHNLTAVAIRLAFLKKLIASTEMLLQGLVATQELLFKK